MPQLMKLDRRREKHEALADLTVDLRGLAVERNMAMVIPQQGTRGAESAEKVRGDQGSGSIEMLGVTDNAITYSQTEAEEEHGLARLYTQKVRNDAARATVCITQHYASGQFCMDSYTMNKSLQKQVKEYMGVKPNSAEDDDDPAEVEEASIVKRRR